MSGGRTVNILTRVGEAIGRVWPWKNKSKLFFFFPFYQVGGAEKVHADIAACVADYRPWLFFIYKSENENFKHLFEKHGRLFNLSSLINNRYAYYVCLGALKTFINRQDEALVFGSNNLFFYDLLPHLKKSVRRIDLLHNFGGGIEQVSLPFVHEIDTRVICIARTLSDLKAQYAAHNVDPQLLNRVELIELQVRVPDYYPEKHESQTLKALYVGRASEEKRVHLVAEAARRCQEKGIRAEFVFVGVMKSELDSRYHNSGTFKGLIADPVALDEIYDRADVLVLTSIYEGTSLVVMEAMAHGVVPVSTNVGGISTHVEGGVNGLLIDSIDEEEIVSSLVTIIERLALDRTSGKEMSRRADEYARQHFTVSKFCAAYRQLLLAEGPLMEKRSSDGHGS